MIQRPSYFNPFRYPDRAQERRNIVLLLMKQNGYLTEQQYQQAVDTPVQVKAEQSEFSNSQYFVDLMNEEVQTKLDDQRKQTRFIYTTLDPDLQNAAQQAVAAGMESVDKLLHCGAAAPKPGRGAKEGVRLRRDSAAGRADCARSAYRRDQGAGRRPQLRDQPVEPRARDAAARLGFQAVRLCGGARNGGRRRIHHFHAGQCRRR